MVIAIQTERIASNAIQELLRHQRFDLALERALDEVSANFTEENGWQLMRCNRAITDEMVKRTPIRNLTLFDVDNMDDEKAKRDEIVLPTKQQVEKDIKVFEAQKKVLSHFAEQLNRSVKDSPLDWKMKLLESVEANLINIANIRGQYISYNVISPHLYEAHRIAYIARGFWNDDEVELRRAAEVAAKGCHKTWLLQSTPLTRWQFRMVMQYLRANLSETEWEMIKADTTLVDSLDESKARGPISWLSQST